MLCLTEFYIEGTTKKMNSHNKKEMISLQKLGAERTRQCISLQLKRQ